MLIISIIILILASSCCSSKPRNESICNQEILDGSFVTSCRQSFCENLFDGQSSRSSNLSQRELDDWPRTSDEVIQISSSRAGDRFKITKYKAFDTLEYFYEESHVNGTIFVDTDVKYQRILGFGSTLTDSSCVNLNDLPAELRSRVIQEYFGVENGISLNILKIPIGSTKFSYTNYALDQIDGDNRKTELSAYDIDHRIPLIREAMDAAGRFKNRIKLIAYSPTAPGPLKDNKKLINGGFLVPNKIPNYASYLLGFVEAYKERELDIWSLILSESPATILSFKDKTDELNYNSMKMRPTDIMKLVQAISSEAKSRHIKESNQPKLLLLGDDRDFIPVWTDKVLRPDTETASKIAGVAYKCRSDKPTTYDNLVHVTRNYPYKYLLASEGTSNKPVKLGNWQYAENYATEIVKNLEFGSVGWIDANLMLDLSGGPSIDPRFRSDAPIIVDHRRSCYYRNPMFYAIGHLSRYVRPGSIRVKIDFFSSAHMFSKQQIAFVTPENYLVVFIMNNNIGPMPVNIGINKRTKVEALLDTKSFNTFIFRL